MDGKGQFRIMIFRREAGRISTSSVYKALALGTWDAEAEGPRVPGQLWLCIRPCLKKDLMNCVVELCHSFFILLVSIKITFSKEKDKESVG